MNDIVLLLLAYSTMIFAVSLLGGKLSAIVTLTHTRTHLVMSFVAGFLLGVAMYHLLLHSLEDIPGPHAGEIAVGCVVLGVIMMIVLLRFFRFHQHEFGQDPVQVSDHDGRHDHPDSHDHPDPHDHPGHQGQPDQHGHQAATVVNPRSVFGVATGLGLHTITEGIALGASMRMGLIHDEGAVLVGLGVLLAIMLHKPLDAYSIIGLMRVSGYANRTCTLTNFGFALLCPLITVLTFFGVGLLSHFNELHVVGYVMAFAAGVFLCIALSDLLPEIQFHSHDRGILALVFLIGVGLAYALFHFESETLHGLETLDNHNH
ncbi:MAG: ZIP family metal transporter [Gemmatimonadetes bacterium]|nr:ZIP family metal transporter [Gemmatimonadota bacterium]